MGGRCGRKIRKPAFFVRKTPFFASKPHVFWVKNRCFSSVNPRFSIVNHWFSKQIPPCFYKYSCVNCSTQPCELLNAAAWIAQRSCLNCLTQLLELLNAAVWLIADVRKRTCDEQQLSDTAKLDEHLWNKQCANNEPAIFSNFLTSSITSITHLSRHLSLCKYLATNELTALVIDVIDDLTKKYSRGLLSLDGREHVL